MKMMQSIIIGSAFLLLIIVQQGSAIKCFICNSHNDANCALDIPPDNLLKDCRDEHSSRHRGPSTYCRKIKQIIEFSVNSLPPDSRIIRTCGWENQTSTNYCYQRAGFGGRQVVCSCDTDNCNAAGSIQISKYLIGSILAGFLLIFKSIKV